jgi:hypothetical protein
MANDLVNDMVILSLYNSANDLVNDMVILSLYNRDNI